MQDWIVQRVWENLMNVERLWQGSIDKFEPSAEDVAKVLDRMIRALYDEKVDQIEVGGMLVKRTDNHVDVYTHIGEIHDDRN